MSYNRSRNHSIDIFSLQNLILEVLVSVRFLGNSETRTNLHSFCSKHENSSHTTSISNTTSPNNRDRYRICNLSNKSHSCQFTDMATSFHTFCDNSIRSQFFHTFSECNRWNNWDYCNSSFVKTFHIFTWVACTSCNNFYTFFNNKVNNIVNKWRQKHNINTEWLVSDLFYSVNISFYHFFRGITATNNSESTSI